MRKIQIQKFFPPWILFAGLIITAVFYSAGCASRRSETTPVSSFAAIGKDADVYVFLPVKGNEPLLSALFTAFVPEKTAAQYISRTSVLYAGFRYGTHSSLSLISDGSYPAGLAGLVFSKKNGWKKYRSSDAGKTVYYRSESADAALLSNRTAAVLAGAHPRNIEALLQRFKTPEQPVFSPRFTSFIETGADKIGVYLRSAKAVAAELFGLKDIELPLTSIELYLEKQQDSYRYSAVFETHNARTALVLRLLLGNVLKGSISVDGAAVFLENADITEEHLAELLAAAMGIPS